MSLDLMAPIMFVSLIFFLLLGYPVIAEYLRSGTVPRLPTAVLATGMMILAFLSLFSGLILDTVTRGRKEAKLLRYLELSSVHAKSMRWQFMDSKSRLVQ